MISETYQASRSLKVLTVDLSINESDTALNFVGGSIDWGDGNTTDIPKTDITTDRTYTSSKLHAYTVSGTYVITLYARNYRFPNFDESIVSFQAELADVEDNIVSKSWTSIGPIVPKDNGSPNSDQWNFSTGTDEELVISSLTLLLKTQKGSRLMTPEYGTNLRRIIFNPDANAVALVAREEIQAAIMAFEPRVNNIQSIITQRTDDRSAKILLECSINSNQPLQVSVDFSR